MTTTTPMTTSITTNQVRLTISSHPFTEASHPLEARVTKDANNHARVFCYMFC